MKLLGIKAFLRGGYREQTQPILVVSHSEPAGIWIPIPKEVDVDSEIGTRVAAVQRTILGKGRQNGNMLDLDRGNHASRLREPNGGGETDERPPRGVDHG